MTTSLGALPVDLDAVKRKQQATWASGDYSVIGASLVIVAEQLCEAADLRAGQRVLDVATGTGITAIAAARRHCRVTGLDYVPSLLLRARERAAAERLEVHFEEGDAERMRYEDASFDVVLSTFGVMFTPDQERAASELLRVCRPGGKIGLASWCPQGFIGRVFESIAHFVPPPAGLRSPARWGHEAWLGELLHERVATLETTRRTFAFRYRSPEHWVETFRTYYGPVQKAFAAVGAEREHELADALLALLRRFDVGGGAGIVVPSDYLEVVATRAT